MLNIAPEGSWLVNGCTWGLNLGLACLDICMSPLCNPASPNEHLCVLVIPLKKKKIPSTLRNDPCWQLTATQNKWRERESGIKNYKIRQREVPSWALVLCVAVRWLAVG